MRSISSALAVNIMIGMWRVAESVFRILHSFQARHFRQHQIQNDEGRLFRTGFAQPSHAIVGRRNRKPAGFTKIQGEKIDNVPLVLDDQDFPAGCRFHTQQLSG